MTNKVVYSAPMEFIIDTDVVDEVSGYLSPSLENIQKHYTNTEEDVSKEVVIAIATKMAGAAIASGMDLDVLLTIVRRSFFNVIEGIVIDDDDVNSFSEKETNKDKKSIN